MQKIAIFTLNRQRRLLTTLDLDDTVNVLDIVNDIERQEEMKNFAVVVLN